MKRDDGSNERIDEEARRWKSCLDHYCEKRKKSRIAWKYHGWESIDRGRALIILGPYKINVITTFF